MRPVLEIKDLSFSYEGEEDLTLSEINIKVNKGEIVLLAGESGSGKSTLVRLINGLCPHFYQGKIKGSVTYNLDDHNHDISTQDLTLPQISSFVGSLFQDPERQFFALTVEEEIGFALEWQNLTQDEIAIRVKQSALFTGIWDIKDNLITKISEGQKQRVGIASLLALGPRVLVLDEPTANLDYKMCLKLGELLISLKNAGITVIIADHRLFWLKDVVDSIYLLDKGRVVCQMSARDLANLNDTKVSYFTSLRKISVDDLVKEANGKLAVNNELKDFAADDLKSEGGKGDPDENKNIVEISGLSFSYKNEKEIFNNISFSIPKGMSALIGENGLGKTTLCRILFGLEKITSGKITVGCVEINKKNAHKYISLVLQNADYQLNLNSVEAEVELTFKLAKIPFTQEIIDSMLKKVGLLEFKHRHPQTLSGGQKQRLVILLGVIRNKKLLILDEPTSGLDAQNITRVIDLLNEYVEHGGSVLFVTHDYEFISASKAQVLQIENIIKSKE